MFRFARRLAGRRAGGGRAAAAARYPQPVSTRSVDKHGAAAYLAPPLARAQVAELVDALVSGTSGESRGGSSPLLGTNPF